MSNVVEFIRPDPHVTGPAMCSECGYKWQACAPVGTRALECSECGKRAGAWRYAVFPGEGDVLQCNCGGNLFVVTRHKYMCATCGDGVNP